MATIVGFLARHGLEGEMRLNLEANHASLAGHTFHHEVATALSAGAFAWIDANRGTPQNGWDTDQFPNSAEKSALVLYEILAGGGFATGGLNLDTKLRRPSVARDDLFHGHVGAGMGYTAIVPDPASLRLHHDGPVVTAASLEISVTNAGDRPGSTVLFVFAGLPGSAGHRPRRAVDPVPLRLPDVPPDRTDGHGPRRGLGDRLLRPVGTCRPGARHGRALRHRRCGAGGRGPDGPPGRPGPGGLGVGGREPDRVRRVGGRRRRSGYLRPASGLTGPRRAADGRDPTRRSGAR